MRSKAVLSDVQVSTYSSIRGIVIARIGTDRLSLLTFEGETLMIVSKLPMPANLEVNSEVIATGELDSNLGVLRQLNSEHKLLIAG